MSDCEHIWNAHNQCQWCHRDKQDIDYEESKRDATALLLLASPGITPMSSLSGVVSQLNHVIAGLLIDATYDVNAVQSAINCAVKYGGVDGSHHKTWVIDQMVRMLSGNQYDAIVAGACDGDDGPNTYSWDEGIAP
jgi:hypothetical protein